jgi:hypothetical protein
MAKRTGGFIGQDGINAPDPATGVTGTAGTEQVTVSFAAPSDVGGATITGYRVQSNDGIGASGSASPITVTGLTNGTSYTFNVWAINPFGWSSPSDASASVAPLAPQIGLFAGYFTGSAAGTTIESINILSAGNGTDFGDLSVGRYSGAGMSSSTRAVFGGGNDRSAGNDSNHIDYVAFSTGGTCIDFGDCTAQFRQLGGTSNGTYGGMFQGYEAGVASRTIQRITIASTGNATDQGDAQNFTSQVASCGNTTYAITGGGRNLSNNEVNIIERSTWSTISSATDFGDLTVARFDLAAVSSSTRAVWAGGSPAAGGNVIDYVTIASAGNATDFGDLSYSRNNISGVSNKTTGVFSENNYQLTMDSITIASTGNATDFGDMINYQSYAAPASTSDSHGGIS